MEIGRWVSHLMLIQNSHCYPSLAFCPSCIDRFEAVTLPDYRMLQLHISLPQREIHLSSPILIETTAASAVS